MSGTCSGRGDGFREFGEGRIPGFLSQLCLCKIQPQFGLNAADCCVFMERLSLAQDIKSFLDHLQSLKML